MKTPHPSILAPVQCIALPAWRLIAGALLLASLAGCNDIASRIQEKIAAFNQLSTDSQARVRDQNIGVGDAADMVYVAFGTASATVTANTDRGRAEVWTYKNIPASTPAVALQDNNPGVRYQASRESSSAPRNEASLSSTKSSGPSATIDVSDAAVVTLYVGLVNGVVVRLSVTPLDPKAL